MPDDDTTTIKSRGHRHDRRRALQGLRALHPRVPARRAHDVDRGEPHGLPLSRAASRVHRLRGVPLRVPRLRVRGVPLRAAASSPRSRHDRDVDAANACSMEGSEALARAAIVAGCRFFAGYPMTPFTEVLEHFATPAPRRGRRVHQRRVGARSGRHGVGRAGDRRPRRDRLDRPGPLAHAGVVLGDHARRAAARHLQHGARPAGLLPGDARRRSRRLPPHRARAAGRARRRRARAARVPPRRQVAQPGAHLRRLPPRAHAGSARDRADRRSRRCPPRTGRSTARARAAGSAAAVTPLGVGKVGQRALGQEGKAQYIATKIPFMEREVRVETGFLDDAETVIVAFGSPAKFVKYAIAQLRAAGHRIGYVRPITLWPFPYDDGRARPRAARTCGASAASSSSAGQMVDDVRIGVAGRAPVDVHRRRLDRPLRLRRRAHPRRRGDRGTHPRVARRPRAAARPRLRVDVVPAPGAPGMRHPMTRSSTRRPRRRRFPARARSRS